MELEKLIKDLQKSIVRFEECMNDDYGKEKYKGGYAYAVTILGYLEELKELRIVNKNISRELITRTDKLIEK